MKSRRPKDLFAGSIHETKNGKIEVLDYINSSNVIVRFIDTGFEVSTHASQIRIGNTKDLLAPSVCGVGIIGMGDFSPESDAKAYKSWSNMIKRCYSKRWQVDRPTYSDCSVASEWHNFQSYASWYYENLIDGFQVDKDIKVSGNRVYSPETCSFVSAADNSEHAHAKSYRLKSPSGDVFDVYNIRRFACENGLLHSHLYAVHKGSRASHKGWTRA